MQFENNELALYGDMFVFFLQNLKTKKVGRSTKPSFSI